MASSMTVHTRVSSSAFGRAAPRFRVSLTQALRLAPAPNRHQKAFHVRANEKQGKGGEEGGRKFDDSVFGKLAKSPNFPLLSSAILKAGLEPTLVGKGPFTVFAPTDDAFFQAAKDLGVSKVELVSLPQMADILKNHVLEGEVLSSSLKDGDEPTTIGGGKLKISVSGGVKVNDATVKKADFKATNGVIHVVDKVLLP
ncbi:Fasciclin-domain-containing protein [Coccomyxa subellipsoidea C-169]|uniref:Fasciclin-domain-containing protein n=1 Tax=Coccomyxa subellipsoidea (strain C-169) TaxID=574566 RepID=I0ZAN2_COCSC|nr:Fasciclin-domain-containing protein [Coccomyxa subellipsoidea C-169]EIE27701.1 Fasciclin-domain-containing protein [Coccomyxa subellipsoidea C-169]|eukprot:XP_005652245.1 Fasciclin-domain-containing protein [Coccomyxa subellipsoidea C-169]